MREKRGEGLVPQKRAGGTAGVMVVSGQGGRGAKKACQTIMKLDNMNVRVALVVKVTRSS